LAIEALQTWLIDGLVTPYRVAGDSMACALVGVHRNVVCKDCGFRFSCGTGAANAAVHAVCPNCGYAANPLAPLREVSAERLLIDRTAFIVRQPQRWEIAAFERPSEADSLCVKRIVGLPGESIEIRHGDVYVDGQIQRKNLAQQRALAILVHDVRFSSTTASIPCRWLPEGSGSRWVDSGGQFSHTGCPGESVDWLSYHHARRTLQSAVAGPVTDLCAYNPSQTRREEDVHAVSDLMLAFHVRRVSGSGDFCIRMTDGTRTFEARLKFDGNAPNGTASIVGCIVSCDRVVSHVPMRASGDDWLIEASLVDRQFLLAIDGETIVAWPYEQPDPPTDPPTCPLAIGVRRIEAEVSDLRIFRDTYYTHPIGPPARDRDGRPVHLTTGEYYVLGDNSPVSEDSRVWPERGAIDAKWLLGKPLVAIPSTTCGVSDRWHIQVPDLTEIRYIR
jgi:signal peptidase I